MTRYTKFPGLRWHPETGKCELFQKAEDVPAGWLESHPFPGMGEQIAAPGDVEDKPEEPAESARAAVVAKLRQRGVKYNPKLSTAALTEKLRKAESDEHSDQ